MSVPFSTVLSRLALSSPLILCLATAALAQAPGVALGDARAFANGEIVGEEVLRTATHTYAYTYRPERWEQAEVRVMTDALLNELDPTRELTVLPHGSGLHPEAPIRWTWPEPREHYAMSAGRDHLLWTYLTAAPGSPLADVVTEIRDERGQPRGRHLVAQVPRRGLEDLYFASERSPDLSHTALVVSDQRDFSLTTGSHRAEVTLHATVFDGAGRPVTAVHQELPFARNRLLVDDVTVDDDGTVYLVGRIFEGGAKWSGLTRARYDVFALVLRPGADGFEVATLDAGRTFLVGATVTVDASGQAYLVGAYSDLLAGTLAGGLKAGAGYVTGTFRAALTGDSTLTLERQPLPAEFYDQLPGFWKAKDLFNGRIYGTTAVSMRAAMRRDDGSAAILLAAGAADEVREQGWGGRSTIHSTHDGGLLLTFAPDGSSELPLYVPLNQSVSRPATSSPRLRLVDVQLRPRWRSRRELEPFPYGGLQLVLTDDGFGVAYNDNPRNLTRDPRRRARKTTFGGAIAVLATAGPGGRLQRSPLFGASEAEALLHVGSAERGAGGWVAFAASDRRWLAPDRLRLGVFHPERLLAGGE